MNSTAELIFPHSLASNIEPQIISAIIIPMGCLHSFLFHFARKDIYNKNLEKFYVVVDENDTDVSEDEEVEQNIKEETVPQLPSSALACHVG